MSWLEASVQCDFSVIQNSAGLARPDLLSSSRRLRRLYDNYRQVSYNKTIFRRAALTMLARPHSQGRPLAASISVPRCRPLPPLVRNDTKPRCSPVREHCYDRCYAIPTHRLCIVHGYPEPIAVKYTDRVPSHSKPCFR